MKVEFPVSVYGNLERYNDVLSKARCRIFYKYENRNGTYITDEFAEKLLSTIAYAPVKGIYEGGDYTDHGEERNEGRIYGIVPENPHITWEDHTDEDGVTRSYACVDVLIFTALYEEANEIVGKAQSMELYSPSLTYHKGVFNGQQYIVFDEGCFLGLQVLGDDVEPCFEGASFFALQENIAHVIEKIQQIEATYSKKGGLNKMSQINFKLSDSEKFDALWSLLNSNYSEENGWVVEYAITSIYDDYALVFKYEDGQTYRAYYTKDNEKNSVELGEMKKVFIVDVTEQEKNTLDTLRVLNGDTYELVSETLAGAQEAVAQNSEFSAKIEELNNTITTLNTEKADVEANYASEKERNELLVQENNDLSSFKAQIETERKEAVFTEYEGKLSEDVLDTYRAKIADYSIEGLDKELAYELKKSSFSVFQKDNGNVLLHKDIQKSGVDEILSRYVK